MNLWLAVEYVSKRRRKIRHALCVMCNQDQGPGQSAPEGRDLSPSLLADVSWSECYIGIHYRYLMPHSLCLMVQFHPKVAIVVTSHFRLQDLIDFYPLEILPKANQRKWDYGNFPFLIENARERRQPLLSMPLVSSPPHNSTHPYGPIRVSRPSIQREQYSIFRRASSPKPRSLPRSFFA